MGIISNKIDRKQLKPGNHIYSWRQAYLYAHHGIYVGDEMVIHFTSGVGQLTTSSCSSYDTNIPCPKCGYDNKPRTNGVFSSCLDCFLSGGELYMFEYGVSKMHFFAQARGGTCTLASSDPTEEVLNRTFYLLENGFGGYHFFENNCEDFAIYCKTGLLVRNNSVGRSGQAASYKAAAKSAAYFSLKFVPAGYYAMTIVSCATYCYKRLVSDIGYRKDVIKVPVEKIPEMMAREN